MGTCKQCEDQAKKTSNGKPHDTLNKVDEVRIFKGIGARSFEEQDYQCSICQAKFTHSTDKNDLSWTLWQA